MFFGVSFCVSLGEYSTEEAQDPFLVSIHIIADPGESRPLQEAIDKVLAWIHPDLPLFRVSERRACRRRRRVPKGAQPALAVVLFLQEEYGEEPILQLHRTLSPTFPIANAPWHLGLCYQSSLYLGQLPKPWVNGT